jgi:hypothetical protein
MLLLPSAAQAADGKHTAATTQAASTPVVQDITWEQHGDSAALLPATEPGQKHELLKVTGPATVRVLVIDDPGLTHHTYAIVGRVKYENVKGTAYLEMWNTFPDGGAFFSRTLSSGGPMGSLNGSSDWRPFLLPFYSKPGKLPSRLEVNVVLPEGGVVYLEPAQLVQNLQEGTGLPRGHALPPAAGSGGAFMNPWWDNRGGGWFGAIVGSTLGILGAVIGLLAGRGKARQTVFALLIAVCAIGGVSLILGIVAVSIGQPYTVYYPLLLCGALATVLPLVQLPAVRRRYEALELRRMSALDAAS